MKKFISLLLLAALLVTLLAGCGDTGSDSSGSADSENVDSENVNSGNDDSENTGSGSKDVAAFENDETQFNKDELPQYKIAFGYGDWDTALGMQFQAAFEYLCEAYNVEPMLFAPGSGEEGVAAVESLLAGGDIDGIITVTWGTAQQAVADKYGVPVVAACQIPSDAEIDAVAAYDTYLGGIEDDEFFAGYSAMEALYNAGCRNVTISGLTAGYSKGHDQRAAGAKQFASEHSDLNILTESYTTGTWHEDIPTFAAAFPEVDGMWFTALNDGVYAALANEGLDDGSVKVAGPDVANGTASAFANGIQVFTCGGQYATPMIAFAVLYNYLSDGTRIISDPKVSIARNYLVVYSKDELDQYDAVVADETPVYNADEIAELIHYFNADVTYDDLVNSGKTYSLEDIAARRAG